jgi:hypothetical protein
MLKWTSNGAAPVIAPPTSIGFVLNTASGGEFPVGVCDGDGAAAVTVMVLEQVAVPPFGAWAENCAVYTPGCV